MRDCRENLYVDIRNTLFDVGVNPDVVSKVLDEIVLKMDSYEIIERSTEVAIRDDTNMEMLKMYAGTCLTEGKRKNTVEGYVSLLKRFAEDVGKPLLQVNVFDIRIWLAKMQKTCSLRTCENYRSYLSAFYQWLVNEEIIQKNPMNKISPIRFPDKIREEFSEVEQDKLRSACGTLRERAELELLLSSGIRVTEACKLDISDISIQDKRVIVRDGKGGKGRITYMSDVCSEHVRRYLDSRKDELPYLFVNKLGNRMVKGTMEADLKRIGKRAGVDNVHPHRCRRTFASDLYRRGMDIRTIQKLMGHADINTTMIYINTSEKHTRIEYNRFA